MIALKHLRACASVKALPSSLDLSGSLNFCTDNRKYVHPSAFVAIPGEKVNPLDLIDAQLALGCPLVIYQDGPANDAKVAALKNKHTKTNFVAVTDSVTFLQELTHHHVVAWKSARKGNTVFAISGSNGKTTHKEMLSFILKAILPGKIVATEKNNNNHLGVPLTLLNVTAETELVVLELGSNHPGEIKVLCDIAAPNAGLTTNIGATHLEFFGTEEKVFDEEGYLYHAVNAVTKGVGFYLINTDDQFLKRFAPYAGAVTYGEHGSPAAKVTFQDKGATIHFKGKNLVATNTHITGRHNKLNLVTCAFIAQHFFPQKEAEILKAASDFRPTKNRSEWLEYKGRPVFLDAYNANPSSMKAALLGFKESVLEQGLKLDEACVVLGDMNELGESTPTYHKDIGHYLGELGFSQVFFVGRFAAHYKEGFPQGNARKSAAEFKQEYQAECLSHFRIHFIKGSRSLQLESLFDIT